MSRVQSPPDSPELPTEHTRLLISELCTELEDYLRPEEVREVYRAYLFGAEAHEGQHRMSGEPYIYHPIAVAKILAEMHMDASGIIAAILHDVIEDTETAKEQIREEFSGEIAELVDGVSKLTLIDFKSHAEAQAENFRKMLLAMARDIRVILIKLADRTHNMRTLGPMRPEKRRRIARETLEIYAPIANRLGMNSLRIELEDLCFVALYPNRARILAEAVERARGHRKQILKKMETSIKRRLRQEHLTTHTYGRVKHLYGIYQKMVNKHLPFAEVFDVYAFRIVVDNVDTCYRALGVMHSLYKPVPGRFKDYIAIPKSNGYQSLHTILFGPHGVPIEVQIRARDMHQLAESGIAAHWMYKAADGSEGSTRARASKWLHGLLEMQKSAGDSQEFLENVKVDLFADEVYVFTPAGDIMELPRGSTGVDFAYAVHTDIGNSCVAARIDRRLAPLRTSLLNGQTVEIITAPGAKPNPAWLNFVVTAKARTNIRSHLKSYRRREAIEFGRRLLDKELFSFDIDVDNLPAGEVDPYLEELQLDCMDELLEDIGLGNRLALLVARRFLPEDARTEHDRESSGPLVIKGAEGMVIHMARCCRPIPGDPIVGSFSAGRGVVIHSANCSNLADYRKRPEYWVDVAWEGDVDAEFTTEIRIEVANQRGVLAAVAAVISEESSNIENVNIRERDGMTSALFFTLTVFNRDHLARIMRHVRANKSVMRISRVKG